VAEPTGRDPRPDPVLVLGSASPARAALLRSAGISAHVLPSAVDEDAVVTGAAERAADPHWVTLTLARAKAADVVAAVRSGRLDHVLGRPPGPDRRVLVVGADSMFDVAGRVLGKARSADEVRARWAVMSARTGVLVTGHAVVDVGSGRSAEATVATTVRFGSPDPIELEAYIASGEPLEVAGSCTIDGLGGPFVEGIDGDHTNVIGLSLPTLRRLLRELGVRWTDLWAAR